MMTIAPNKYKLHQDSVVLWLENKFKLCELNNSMFGESIFKGAENTTENPDISTVINGKPTAFLFTETIEKIAIQNRIKSISEEYERICIVIFDSHLRADLVNAIPKSCGILCISDSFGLGIVYQLMRRF